MKPRIYLIILFFVTFVIYKLTSPGQTPYDYFLRLAKAFLDGKYYLTDNPPWLNELIPLSDGKFGVVFPPVPAIILMPFIYFFNLKFEQQILAHFLGAGSSVLIAKIAFQKSKNFKTALWFFFLAAFGNISWFLSSVGSVWYLGQICAEFFLLASIFESMTKKRAFFVSTFFTMAVFSRLQTILALPLIVYLNKDSIKKKFFSFLAPFLTGSLLFLSYNYIRFNNLFETGYSLIPGVLNEPWYKKGIFDFSYIPNNLKVMFLSVPVFLNHFPYIMPSWGGLSILITTPAFIYTIFTKIKIKENLFTLISILSIMFVTVSHGGTGFTQFGYRYAVDFYPLIFLLLINYLKDKKIKWHHNLLLIFSILVNFWGVLWINKFAWVGW